MTGLLILTLLVLDFIPNFTPPVFEGINLVYLIALIFFILASATDWLDGHLARKWNQITDLGKFMDPIADKLLVDAFLIYLTVTHFGLDNVTFPIFATILMIVRDLAIDALRSFAASKGKVLAANIFGKAKTVLQMVTIPLVLLNDWPFSYFDASWGYARIVYLFIYLTTFASLFSGVLYFIQNRKVFLGDKTDG